MPVDRQTILFSATMPPKIRQLAKNILRDPVEINVAISKPNEAIVQSAYICYEPQKMGIIEDLFQKPSGSKTIIFASSKLKVKDLAYTLKKKKLKVAAMHSDLEQSQREEVMLDFKNNKIDILVATDIVSRGIDIDSIGLVINYDVPHDPEDYIHRIGRTARANAEGAAITFVSEKDQSKFHRIESFIGREIDKAVLPEGLGEAPEYAPEKRRGSNYGRRGSKHGDNRGRGRADRARNEHSKHFRKKTDNNDSVSGKVVSSDESQGSYPKNKKRYYRPKRNTNNDTGKKD